MLYTVLIVLHAAAGVAAFAAGIVALARERFLDAYRWSLVASIGFLVLAIAVTAAERDTASWAVSGALVGLAAVMVARALLAGGVPPGRRAAYVYHVGFGVVGLFDAFWVVALMRAELPGWAVGAVAVGIAVAGHLLLVQIAARSVRPTESRVVAG